jgi:hypothetical protein
MKIGKDGKVWRLTPETWDILLPYDSDPNIAIRKMRDAKHGSPGPAAPAQSCAINEQKFLNKIGEMIKESMAEALKPFEGS